MKTIQHWIGGTLTTGASTRTAPVWNPATGDQPPKTLLLLADDLQKNAAAAVAKDKAAQDELAKERETFKTDLADALAKLKTAQDNLAKANETV